MKRIGTFSVLALSLLLLAGCSSQEENTEPLPESMDQETVLSAGENILDQLLAGEYETVYEEFREDIRGDLTPESVQDLVEPAFQEAGDYQEIKNADVIGSTEGEEHGIARFLCTFSEEEVAINVAFGLAGTNVFDIVFTFLQTPLLGLGDTLGAMVVAYLFLHAFWFFGINGGSVVGAVFNPILQTLAAENLEFFRTGVGEGHIICQQFQDLFATFGGCGSTLSLLIAMILFCKSARIKQLSRLAFIPGVFNINEPIVFGLPIVMNPVIIIPFVLVPTLNIVISYFAMDWGIVPICSGVQIPWTMPLGISGVLATNWMGGVLQILLLIMGVFVYLPFIKTIDNQYLHDEQVAAEQALNEPAEDDIDLDDLSFDDR